MKFAALTAAIAAIAVTLGAQPAEAATHTVLLNIPTMDCATCPIIIKTALLRVAGVSAAEVSYRRREARVTYDDTVTNIDSLRKATAGVGYPALVSEHQR